MALKLERKRQNMMDMNIIFTVSLLSRWLYGVRKDKTKSNKFSGLRMSDCKNVAIVAYLILT